MNIIPIFCVGRDEKEELFKILHMNKINMIFVLNSYLDDEKLIEFLQDLKIKFPKLKILLDLCICNFTHDGHCRIYNNELYDKEETLRIFSRKIDKFISLNIDGIVLSDMNLDTLKLAREKISDRNIEIYSEYKIKSQLYNAYRIKTGMHITEKKYHAEINDNKTIKEFSKLTSNIILKPALSSFSTLMYIKENIADIKYYAFFTTAESQMIEYIQNKYKIKYFKELIKQYEILKYEALFVPYSLLKNKNNI